MKFNRKSARKPEEIREVSIIKDVIKNADGSCLIKIGDTEVICTANLENNVPRFLKYSKTGWLTAEYSMLPSSCQTRVKREVNNGKQSGRTLEIQRLIGRSLRSALDLSILGEKQILIDCDVINADGGTRCASITGGYVALELAIKNLLKQKIIRKNPIIKQIAAISCGIYKNETIIDLDYEEDSNAEVDANFVFSNDGNLIEVQSTGEEASFSKQNLIEMLELMEQNMSHIFEAQNKIISN